MDYHKGRIYNEFFKWYKAKSQNMKDNDMDNEQIAYLSWLEGRSKGIDFAQKTIKKLNNE